MAVVVVFYGRPGVRESPREWSEGIEGGEEVLTEARIGGGVAGEEEAEEMAAAAVVGEDGGRAAPRWRILKIGRGDLLLKTKGTP